MLRVIGTLCRAAKYETAQTLYEKCHLQQPQDVQVLSNLAAVHLSLENWLEALKYARNGLEINPKDIKCLYRCAVAATNLGQYTKAICDLTLAQKLVSLMLPVARIFFGLHTSRIMPALIASISVHALQPIPSIPFGSYAFTCTRSAVDQ